MMDTIVLRLEQPQFEILDHSRFSPSTENLYRPPYPKLGARGMMAYVQNPTKADYEAGNYKPRLTATVRKGILGGFVVTLKIEFSAPKLMKGNNFDELYPVEFGNLLATLRSRLTQMGIKVSLRALEEAEVSAVHYSKNVVFTDHTRCSMVLEELAKLSIWSRLDIRHC